MWDFREQYWEPLLKKVNRYLYGSHMTDLASVKGGYTVGTDFVSKHFRAHAHEIKAKLQHLEKRFTEVDLVDLVEDNWMRLFLFNALERVTTIRQAFPVSADRLFRPDSNSYATTEVVQRGIFGGLLRGSVLNTLQFSTVAFPALYFGKSMALGGSPFLSFAIFYQLFDALFYPLDKIKTLLYNDVSRSYKHGWDVFAESQTLSGAYRGIWYKLAFNVPILYTLFNTVNDRTEAEKILGYVLLAAAYPLNTFKTQNQLIGTQLSTSVAVPKQTWNQGYRGLLPFMLVNILAQHVFLGLSSKSRQNSLRAEAREGEFYYSQSANWGQ